MPYKQRRRRRGATGDYDLDTLGFRERFQLQCGHWTGENRVVSSRKSMLEWYESNRKLFDRLKIPHDFEPGHRPGARSGGWWLLTGFPEFGPRLLVNPEQSEGRISRILDGHWKPPNSFCEHSDKLIANWKAGVMPSEERLREHIAFTVPNRVFPDGYETSIDFLQRNAVLDFEEAETLNKIV